MKRSMKDMAALIIQSKPKHPLKDMDDMGQDTDDDSQDDGDELPLIAGDVLDAIKQDDEQAFAEALETFVKSCKGY